MEAARREFGEETACPSEGDLLPLTPLRQPSGKVIAAWAFQGDCDAGASRSNTFSLEWPPGSGRQVEFPEVDRAGWFTLDEAKAKIIPGQVGFLEELEQTIGPNSPNDERGVRDHFPPFLKGGLRGDYQVLPYNKNLKKFARELRSNQTEAENFSLDERSGKGS